MVSRRLQPLLASKGPGKPVLFIYLMPRSYYDPPADIAIANVDRERSRARITPPQKPKKEYIPEPPVDVWRVIHSPHRKIKFNREWLFYDQLQKTTNGDMH